MSSQIDIKLDYLKATKSLIKQAIINKGIDITDDITLREYANLINDIEVATDQSDATALASDIVLNKTAYNNNNKIIGNLPIYNSISAEVSEINLDENSQIIKGKYSNDIKLVLNDNSDIQLNIPYSNLASIIGLTPEVIKEGVKILGIVGTYNGISNNEHSIDDL